ncbi:MAG: MFS transporter [Acidimicrobiales bacterium]|nr:MFS transporter [Acidimicrobiales bacterium]
MQKPVLDSGPREVDNETGGPPSAEGGVGASDASGAATGRRRADGVRTLFGMRDFRNYWYGSAVFGIGIWAFLTAMGWTALELTDSAFAVSLTNVVYFLPMFVFALPAGVLADVWDRRWTAIVVRAGGGLVAVALALLAGTAALSFTWLLVLSFLVGLSVIGELASRQAYIAQIVTPDRLTNATALTSFQGGVARVVGPLMAGWFIDRFGDSGGYAMFAVSNLLFVVFFLRIRTPGTAPTRERRRMRTELVDGLGYLRRHRDAATIVMMSVFTGTVGWVYLALMPVMARDVLDGDAVVLGSLSMAVGLGSIPGALLLSLRNRVAGEGRIYIASLLVWGAGIIVFGASRSLPLSLIALFVGGVGFGMQTILSRTLLLRIVDAAYHGRVLGLLMLTWGANIVGTLTAGSLADLLSVSVVIGASGTLVVILTIGLVAGNRRVAEL